MTTLDEAPRIDLAYLGGLAQEIDPTEDTDADLFRASVVVLACLFKGVDAPAIHEITGYDLDFVSLLLANLEKNDQVKNGMLCVDWLTDDDFDNLGFLTTVLCAAGMIEVKFVPDVAPRKAEGVYQHPDDKSLTWKGRGRRPYWLNSLLESGTLLGALWVPE